MAAVVKFAGSMLLILLTGVLGSCGTSSIDTPSAAPSAPVPASASLPLRERIGSALGQAVPQEEASAISVGSIDGIVLLTGQVLTEAAKARASNAAAFSGGGEMRRLVNELRVVDEIDLSMVEADLRLAASVERLLAASDAALAQRLEVVVENATVYLLGRVNREEGDAAAELVSRLEGVGAVRTVFYLE